MGILFAKRDFLSAFMTCFLPVIGAYYPFMLLGMNLGKEGQLDPRIALWIGNVILGLGGHWSTRGSSSTDAEWLLIFDEVVGHAWGDQIVRILDRQRFWAFFKAYCTCYVSLVGLFIVIDAFSNMDEFQKRARASPRS